MGRIGYIRVSTEHQETARQEAIMKQYQVENKGADLMEICYNKDKRFILVWMTNEEQKFYDRKSLQLSF